MRVIIASRNDLKMRMMTRTRTMMKIEREKARLRRMKMSLMERDMARHGCGSQFDS
jgi:hypothetical protein